MTTDNTFNKRFELLAPVLDERLRRLVASAEAEAIGRGGISLVSEATGVSRRAIRIGKQELHDLQSGGQVFAPVQGQGFRKPGGGRKKTVDKDTILKEALDALVNPTPAAIRKRPYDGRARVSANLRRNCVRWDMKPATGL
jgi:hypothetical protein